MALIEDLIAQVTETALREAIAREVSDLKKRLSWGLTFERHAPEIAWLRHAPVAVGATVIDRRTTLPWRVVAVDGDTLTIEADGATRTIPRIEAFVETRFDEAVYPALTSLGAIRRGPAERPTHAVIEGENYYALELLSFTHAGRFDCVYLDPPYNTLDDDWKYNNRYIDRNDSMRHSKWLSMMERRLRLARRVLKPDGTLVVAIDENEHAYLVMLLEQLFRGYEVTSVAVVHNPRGIQGDNFSFTNDFAVFVVPGKSLVAARALSEAMSDEDPYPSDGDEADEPTPADEEAAPAAEAATPRGWPLRNWGTESLRTDARNCFYPIYVRDDEIVSFGDVAANDYHPTGVNEPGPDGTTAIWPIDPKGVERKWRYARQSVEAIRAQLLVRHIRGRVDIDLVKEAGAFRTVWRNPRYDANTYGTQIISRFIDEPFPYPKSLYTMRDVLYAVTGDRPDALILDYFAGSGTTLHATWLLNAEDGGNRQCFLVTNNEVEKSERARLAAAGHFEGDREFEARGIFEAVTRPRLTAALKGIRADETMVEGRYLTGRDYAAGFEENVEYLRLDFLDPIDVQLGLCAEALAPTIWLMAGAIGDREPLDPAAAYHLPANAPYAIVIEPSGVAELVGRLADRPDVRRVFIVAGSDDAYAAVAERLPEGIETTLLYRAYLDACRRVGESTR